MRRAVLVSILAAFSGACGGRELPPDGQLVIYVDTDAPLGFSDAPAPDLLATSGLFDRMRADVLSADGTRACDDCSRDFTLTQGLVDEGRLSFGVRLPPGRTGYRVRVRLFLFEAQQDGEPRSDATIDGMFALPAQAEEGVTEVTAFLAFADLAKPVDLSKDPPPAQAGRALRGARVQQSTRATCASAPQAGEVCVPGGVFWANRLVASVSSLASWRAFTMSPFFLDAHEVTVAELRASGVVTPTDPQRSAGDSSHCTYTNAAGAFDDLPVTCITPTVASAYCAKRGGALPSGAQYEYIRGRMSALPFVWGLDTPTCTDAVWGRGAMEGFNFCAALGIGPQRAGSGMRDRIVFPTGELLDVAGNVSELMSDWPADCAAQAGVFADPVCGKMVGRAAAASFAEDWTFLQNVGRDADAAPRPTSGFRCMRPGT